MDYQGRRQKVMEKMEQGSLALLYSGEKVHVSADEYAPFEANRNFFYLTGLRRDKMVLLLDKTGGKSKVTLFIERADPLKERWTGHKVTVDEAKQIAGIEDVVYFDELEGKLNRIISREDVKTFYFDTYRHQMSDVAGYNLEKANLYANKYPGVQIKNLFPLVARLRMWKDEEEVTTIREAIAITDHALKRVLKSLKPEMKEYQVQAEFEYDIRYHGAENVAFPTIAGSGKNGTMLHYETNQDTCKEGSLILLDLGARYQGYNADITRTYPVNGRYSERQRAVYDVVLAANRKIAATAKAGITLKELNEVCKKVLAEGCIRLGLIENEEEIGKYYMHGVSHHLGIDVHDVSVGEDTVLQVGAVISDEPGLYIDEWEIGIRIEDDLLIQEEGCVVLSEQIMRDPDEIEAFMAQNRLE